jgi:hypothetical protein
MNTLFRRILLISIPLFLISCGSSKFNLDYPDYVSLEKIEYKSKEIYFIPMLHFGDETFYTDVRKKIDSLHKNNFIFYYETVKNPLNIDSLNNDISKRKFRKLYGKSITSKRYDTVTKKLRGKYKYVGEDKIINQPNRKNLNINDNDKKVDIPIITLILEFEKKYGEIKLSNCDIRTDLKKVTYKCKKIKEELSSAFKRDFILKLRNEFVVNKVISSVDNKIVIIYGASHLNEIKRMIENKNTTYNTVYN